MKWVSRTYTGATLGYEWTDDDLFDDLNLDRICEPEAFAQWLHQIDDHKAENPGWSYRIEGRSRNDHGNGYLRIYAMTPATEGDYLAQEKAEKEEAFSKLQIEYLRLKSELLSR